MAWYCRIRGSNPVPFAKYHNGKTGRNGGGNHCCGKAAHAHVLSNGWKTAMIPSSARKEEVFHRDKSNCSVLPALCFVCRRCLFWMKQHLPLTPVPRSKFRKPLQTYARPHKFCCCAPLVHNTGSRRYSRDERR